MSMMKGKVSLGLIRNLVLNNKHGNVTDHRLSLHLCLQARQQYHGLSDQQWRFPGSSCQGVVGRATLVVFVTPATDFDYRG